MLTLPTVDVLHGTYQVHADDFLVVDWLDPGWYDRLDGHALCCAQPKQAQSAFLCCKKKYLGPISSIKQGANLISAQAVATGM